MMSKNIRTISVAAVIVAAGVLIYGFIDMQSYRSGYISGYSAMSRVVDAACMAGDVLDTELCVRLENDLYADGGDGVYSATAIDAFGPSLVEKVSMPLATIGLPEAVPAPAPKATAPAKRSRRSRRASASAPVPVAAQEEVPAAIPAPAPEPVQPAPLTSGQIAAQINCSAMKTEAACSANALEPYCKWDIYDAFGAAAAAPRCRDKMFKISIGGDLAGVCAERGIKDRLPAAYKYVGTDPATAQEVTVCISPINGKFGYLTPQGQILGDVMSASEMLRVPALRTKGQSIGATVVSVTQSSTAVTCAPPPAPPTPGCVPPANMAPPMNMPPPSGQAMAPRDVFFASLVEIIRSFWYARK